MFSRENRENNTLNHQRHSSDELMFVLFMCFDIINIIIGYCNCVASARNNRPIASHLLLLVVENLW